MEAATFTCSICGESSRDICVFCTKDTCANHLCERCHGCSDCCPCDMPLTKLVQEDVDLEAVTSVTTETLLTHNGTGAPVPDEPL